MGTTAFQAELRAVVDLQVGRWVGDQGLQLLWPLVLISSCFLGWGPVTIIEKVGPWSIFSRPKNGSTSLQNSLFEHNAKSRSASKRRNSVFDSAQLCSRSYFAVTSRLLRSHFAVTTWLLRSRYGYYAVFMRLLRLLCGHYGYYAVRKSTYSRLRKRSTSFQNGYCCRPLISLMFQNGFIMPQIDFKFDSIKRKNGFNNASCLLQQ